MRKKLFTSLVLLALLTAGWTTVSAADLVTLESVDAFVQNSYPLGELDDYMVTGFGAGGQLNLAVVTVPGLTPYIGLDYSYGISDSIQIILPRSVMVCSNTPGL